MVNGNSIDMEDVSYEIDTGFFARHLADLIRIHDGDEYLNVEVKNNVISVVDERQGTVMHVTVEGVE